MDVVNERSCPLYRCLDNKEAMTSTINILGKALAVFFMETAGVFSI